MQQSIYFETKTTKHLFIYTFSSDTQQRAIQNLLLLTRLAIKASVIFDYFLNGSGQNHWCGSPHVIILELPDITRGDQVVRLRISKPGITAVIAQRTHSNDSFIPVKGAIMGFSIRLPGVQDGHVKRCSL